MSLEEGFSTKIVTEFNAQFGDITRKEELTAVPG